MTSISYQKHIPGIHNYCDRWCERCSMTAGCTVYSAEKADDAKNLEFWERIQKSLQIAMKFLSSKAKECGIDLSIRESTLPGPEPPATYNMLARDYAASIQNWLDAFADKATIKASEFEKRERLMLPNDDPLAEATELNDALEIVRWYQFFIYAKLKRASETIPFEPELVSSDANGSAKVALIAIDRSFAAWGSILESFPEEQDSLLPILADLQALRRQVETAFPKARDFRRPGFDA